MWRVPDLSVRSEKLELMDHATIGEHDLVEMLVQLRRINRVLGAGFPTLEGVRKLWRQADCPDTLTLLDVGAGSGESNRLLLRWARLHRIHLHITLLDLHPDTCAVAEAYYQNEPRVTVQQGDLFTVPPDSVDIVTASLVLHHVPTQQIAGVLHTLARASRLGVVINDLHRHPLAWIGIWLITHLFSRNRLIRHDGPLSVQRGFRPADFERLRSLPDLAGLQYHWRPLFRYLIIVPPLNPSESPGRNTHTHTHNSLLEDDYV
jgi:2-polyprenyl-3-methyl-5-hydroxy-6-metoxy-1,4-benzoquinol methylase